MPYGWCHGHQRLSPRVGWLPPGTLAALQPLHPGVGIMLAVAMMAPVSLTQRCPPPLGAGRPTPKKNRSLMMYYYCRGKLV